MGISITIIIIIFTALISYQGFNRYTVIERLKHSPILENRNKEYYRLLTSGFVHADWTHLLINMFVLYSFGSTIESYITSIFPNPLGNIIFVVLYMLNVIIANIPTAIIHKDNPSFSSIGASGAVSGMVFIFILLNPWAILNLFFVIPIPAIIAGIGYLIYSSWAARKGHGRLDHMAHFAGAIGGILMITILNFDILSDFMQRLVSDFPF